MKILFILLLTSCVTANETKIGKFEDVCQDSIVHIYDVTARSYINGRLIGEAHESSVDMSECVNDELSDFY